MRNYKTIIRSCLFYVMAVVVATGSPLTVLATTDPTTPETVASETTVAPETTDAASPSQGSGSGDQLQAEPAPVVEQQVISEPASDTVTPEAVVTPEALVSSSTEVPPPVPSGSSVPASTSEPTVSSQQTHDTAIDATNNLNSQAQTGDASVSTNTTGGNATSGDAAATTTIINTVHSTIQGDTEGVAHFTADIYGNVVGDITLSPVLDAAMSNQTNTPSATTAIHADQAANLTNNISLNATSGDADVTDNTTAGNATTGSADTVANIINLINTIIAANKSFVGTINIYGNLDGDILVSSDFIPQLLASNATGIPGVNGTPSILSVDDTQAIVNNVNLDAMSGDASVLNNTTAGGATTGKAATNLTILNYAGHDVVASNSLLIFVNVLGQWVGVIVDAPEGATAAVLGNGVTSNTVNQAVSANTTGTITNNLDLTSRSGDATVQGNTTAGNATSGDATASANIANISTSVFSVSDWFGILFINVFGTWHGSFGVNTANGTVIPLSDGVIPLANVPPVPLAPTAAPAAAKPHFGFVPRHTPWLPLISNDTASTATEAVPEEAAEDATQAPVASLASVIGTPQSSIASDDQTSGNSGVIGLSNLVLAFMVIAGLSGAAWAAIAGLRQK